MQLGLLGGPVLGASFALFILTISGISALVRYGGAGGESAPFFFLIVAVMGAVIGLLTGGVCSLAFLFVVRLTRHSTSRAAAAVALGAGSFAGLVAALSGVFIVAPLLQSPPAPVGVLLGVATWITYSSALASGVRGDRRP